MVPQYGLLLLILVVLHFSHIGEDKKSLETAICHHPKIHSRNINLLAADGNL